MDAKEFLWQCGGNRALFEEHFDSCYQYIGNDPNIFEEVRHRGCTGWIRDGRFAAAEAVVIATLQIRWYDAYNYKDVCEIHRRGDLRMMRALVRAGVDLFSACLTVTYEQNFDVAKFLINAGCRAFDMYTVIATGKIEWVRMCHDAGVKLNPKQDMQIAAREGLDILKFVHAAGGLLAEYVYTNAVYSLNVQALEYLDSCGCPVPADICGAGAEVNSIEVLEYLVARGHVLDATTFASASEIKTFEWLIEHKCPMSAGAFARVIKANRKYPRVLGVLQYLISLGLQPDLDAWLAAANLNDYIAIKWCLDHIPKITNAMMMEMHNYYRQNDWAYDTRRGVDPTAVDAGFKLMAIHLGQELSQFVANSTRVGCQVVVTNKKTGGDIHMYAMPVAEDTSNFEEGVLAIVKKYKYDSFTYLYELCTDA